MEIQPYLFFNGRCEEAVEFYKALGAKVEMLMRFGDSPRAPEPGGLPPGMEKKVMHAAIRIGESMVLMTDGPHRGARFSRLLAVAVAGGRGGRRADLQRRSPMAGRCGCRSRRRSSRRASAC